MTYEEKIKQFSDAVNNFDASLAEDHAYLLTVFVTSLNQVLIHAKTQFAEHGTKEAVDDINGALDAMSNNVLPVTGMLIAMALNADGGN